MEPEASFVEADLNQHEATALAQIMNHCNLMHAQIKRGSNAFNGFNAGHGKATKATSFVETFMLKQGLKKFGQRGHDSIFGEMKQLHQRAIGEAAELQNDQAVSVMEKGWTRVSRPLLQDWRRDSIWREQTQQEIWKAMALGRL